MFIWTKYAGLIAIQYVFIFLFLLPNVALAQTEILFNKFSTEQLTQDEIKVLQAAMTLSGDYVGLIDGEWGSESQASIERYAAKQDFDYATNLVAADLAVEYFVSQSEYGWQYQVDDYLGLAVLVPAKRLDRVEDSEFFENYTVVGSSIGVSLNLDRFDRMSNIHNFAASENSYPSDLYTVRKSEVWITSFLTNSGKVGYVRSNFHDGLWGTIFITGNRADRFRVNLIAASLTRNLDAHISVNSTPTLDRYIDLVISLSEEAETQPPPQETARTSSTGTGFYINPQGYILTNSHVIKGCKKISAQGQNLRLMTTSNNYDLAVLKAENPDPNQEYARFAPLPARLNSDVTVIGYPLSSILGGVNVTRGAISSLNGIGGDETTYQITAPVQAGNSGGPVLNDKGEVIAVVVSKLREDVIADITGDIPQNVNFAIKGEVVKNYLFSDQIDYEIAQDTVTLGGADLAEKAQSYTVFIECE